MFVILRGASLEGVRRHLAHYRPGMGRLPTNHPLYETAEACLSSVHAAETELLAGAKTDESGIALPRKALQSLTRTTEELVDQGLWSQDQLRQYIDPLIGRARRYG
ncbi:hypothetical protein ACPF7Z_18565 [Halomonas sp. GXIMD04776]|uniref:hypothetical protein n=1 Tax=Halomonas sp. GXIMD04776 TaxID=3415605 RepID=UPI003C846D20